MLHSQRATSNSVCFVFSFFVSRSDCQNVYNISSRSQLSVCLVGVHHHLFVSLPYLVNNRLELSSLFELADIRVSLHLGPSCEGNVLSASCNVLHPSCNPKTVFSMNDSSPASPWQSTYWNMGFFAKINSNSLGHNALLNKPWFRMSSSSLENGPRLHSKVTYLFPVSIHYRIRVLEIDSFVLQFILFFFLLCFIFGLLFFL